MPSTKWFFTRTIFVLPAVFLAACGGDAHVELAAADSIDHLVGGLTQAVQEYDRDILATDDHREQDAIGAFIARVRSDPNDETKTDQHAAEFTEAMERLRKDRAIALQRLAATRENLAVLVELAGGLRRLAVESLSVSDESRRYLQDLLQRQRETSTADANAESSTPRKGKQP